jgi:beta-N-acetylhexosaminidase
MLGQMIVARFAGPTPSNALLDSIRSGAVGGVILFSDNVAGGESATRELIRGLQRAAKEGGNPPLLTMTDQEGGEVKRLAWAPPTLAPSAMASSAIAQAEGEATGRALRSVGVNVDLAPVADVERVAGSFLHARAFGSQSEVVAERACAFANGIAAQGVGFTLKHFPGLGRALNSTDLGPVTVNASASALRGDYEPYLACGTDDPDALVMVSSAIYPSLTGDNTPAVLSPEIYSRELGLFVGSATVTISDDLQAGALAHEATPAERAIKAGLDLLLYAQTQEGSEIAYRRLLVLAQSGGIRRSRLEEAYQAIRGLKERVAGASPAQAAQGSASPAAEGAISYPESVGAPETVKPESTPEAVKPEPEAGKE